MLSRKEYRAQIDDDVISWRYWNCRQAAIYIVAVRVTWRNDGAWFAYIGASQDGQEIEEAGVNAVRRFGEGLPEGQARSFFPQLADYVYCEE